jgi:deoxyguanosine kinase
VINFHRNRFIAIEGVIGVGKTTLTRRLQSRFENARILLEVFEENPFLAEFYQDRDQFAFQTQIFFLLSRYHQQHEAVPNALRQGTLLADYTFAKDELFAWLNLRDDELAMYGRVHAALGDKIPSPDLIVYLQADHEVIMRRIALRDRPYERDMDPDYIKQLAAAYDAWLGKMQSPPVLVINTNELDFLGRDEDLDLVAIKIKEALQKLADEDPVTREKQDALLQYGGLANFQEFHRHLDQDKGFDPDLFLNFTLLTEELGELATELVHIWRDSKRLEIGGRDSAAAHQEAIARRRQALRSELADVLAYTIKLANYTGVDLEQAYRDKMRQNIQRTWGSD